VMVLAYFAIWLALGLVMRRLSERRDSSRPPGDSCST
jgi:hypothetical protein